ncbi:chromosomal replication initiator protein DnaA [Candidatus Xianfuyuplasma coldseepsis]|uniref:Chromosomal replication initiator protein DnaA n=1 Tax=Candidatus Xianfuyuplasma coldseepsis TaxID=2782163 RepID=A0A7L7KQU0_9MOLU|nr:chromosomal replication initiator protein DnaA [Xianfuyuplasma coldseepsis]QMS84945.1 chromosomal replication initiator protein DnaA [Xianfuyuplasma coldseepsis]
MEKYNTIWEEIKQSLEDDLDDEVFTEIFEPVNTVFKVVNNYIYLIAPNDFIKRRIEMLYLNKLNRYLELRLDDPHKFRIMTEEQASKELADEKEFAVNTPDQTLVDRYIQGNINTSYTFDSFVVGNSNRLAYTSAIKVADQPGIVANPLYIFGDVGLGKTHLMQCVGNYILEGNMNSRVLYVKTDQFVEEYVRHASKKKFDEFNEKYRNVDVLLVDDIQFLSGKDQSQNEFFKLFELLHGQQKQIVITSDRSANELKDIMSRLTSRFEWGVTVDINRPDLDHRIKILRKKLMAETSNADLIPNDVIEYIASVFDNNVRELEGALKRVLFYCTAFNIDFTVKNAEAALENLVKPRINDNFLSENKIKNIMSIVSDYYRISTSDLISKKRTAKYVFPRQVSMYLIKTLYDLPYKKIGTFFNNRDHSTVMHSVEKITNEIEMDINVKKDVEKLTIKCGQK